jgi:ubiquinone/menaquinone biosynthesis C-methylase UbiE
MKRHYIEPGPLESFEEALGYDKIIRLYYHWLNRPQVKIVLRLIKNRKNLSILDVGTGVARIPIAIAKRRPDCEIYAIDYSQNMLKVARENIKKEGLEHRITLFRMDGESLDFKDSFFDIVICSGMLHHLKDPTKVLNEIKRVVRRERGIIIINDPVRPPNELILNLMMNIFGLTYNKVMKKEYRDTLYSAFSIKELKEMLTCLGMTGFKMFRSFPHFVTIFKEYQ